MRVHVKLFAVLRERAGTGDVVLELGDAETVASAAIALAERVPAIANYLSRVAFAVNREYVPRDTILREGDELAVIPAVSGGKV
jgi:molybdopterin converting factor subunit 1